MSTLAPEDCTLDAASGGAQSSDSSPKVHEPDIPMARPVLCTYSKMLFQEHFDFDSNLDLQVGDAVVLNTRRGVEVGRIAAEPGTTRLRRDQSVAGRVLRRASKEDKAATSAVQLAIKIAPELREARRLGRELEIPATFVDVEPMLEANRVVLYYTADGRIDLEANGFISKLAEATGKHFVFRQIGDRDVARLSGDVGSCGEELCCKTFLIDFVPVRMEMAKNQGIAADAGKTSGMCGRLKCCLRYEDDLYTRLKKTMPRNGQPCRVDGDDGWVVSVNLFIQTVTVEIKGKREEFPVEQVEYDKDMSEGEIRRFQREMRAAWAAEAEARRTQREAKSASRGQARPMATEAPSEGSGEVGAEAQDQDDAIAEAKANTEHKHRRRSQPRNEPGVAGRRGGDGRRRATDRPQREGDGNQATNTTDNADGPNAEAQDGDSAGGERPKRRRRRGGRGRSRTAPGNEDSGGESPAGGGEPSGSGEPS